MQRIFALVLLAALSTIGLSGCGNKGPLYLPPEPVEEVPAAQEAAPAAQEAPAAPEVSADAEQP